MTSVKNLRREIVLMIHRHDVARADDLGVLTLLKVAWSLVRDEPFIYVESLCGHHHPLCQDLRYQSCISAQ